MSRKLTTILILLIAIPAALVLMLWLFLVKPTMERRLNQAMGSMAAPITGGPFKVFFLGAQSPTTLTINTKPVAIPLEQTSFDISPLSLLSLAPKLRFKSNLFGGQVVASLAYKFSDNSAGGQLEIEGVQISQYPLASMLGISEGTINLQLEQKVSSNLALAPNRIFLTIKGFKKPRAAKLPLWISPLGINIPAIANADLATELSCSPTECKSNRFSITSSLGEASGSFSFPIGGPGELQSSITVSLNQAGKTDLLPYFAIFNQELLSVPDRPFIIKLSGRSDKPKLSVVPIQNSL